MIGEFQDLKRRLEAKKEFLKRWSALSCWSHTANDQLSHIQQQLDTLKLGL